MPSVSAFKPFTKQRGSGVGKSKMKEKELPPNTKKRLMKALASK